MPIRPLRVQHLGTGAQERLVESISGGRQPTLAVKMQSEANSYNGKLRFSIRLRVVAALFQVRKQSSSRGIVAKSGLLNRIGHFADPFEFIEPGTIRAAVPQ
jgi:hypothetical protein